MPPTSPEQASARPPHPLALRLIAAHGGASVRAIDLATGSGRNAHALRGAGIDVLAIDDAQAASPEALAGASGRYAAVLSTHGLLHGTPASIGATLAAVAARLEPQGRLYATFGSTRDARFGAGTQIEPFVFAPHDGDERGVAHAFFDQRRLRSLLDRNFTIEWMEERDADAIAGAWAHREKPLESSVHWFVEARKRWR
jgi:tellurite methyltransferase